MIQDLNAVAQELEKQELQAQGGVSSPQLYTKLLAIYLFQNDLCNAKFLWKRIPPSVKSSHPELALVWSVGKAMWQRDAPAVYNITNNSQWSENVGPIMKLLLIPESSVKQDTNVPASDEVPEQLMKNFEVLDSVRERAVSLVGQAYSSLTVDALSSLVGLPLAETLALAKERGWKVEDGMVIPIPPPPPPTAPASSEDQLHKLTDFVAFLEN